MNVGTVQQPGHGAAVVWLDRSHALVARARDGRTEVAEVARGLDAEVEYFDRVAREAPNCDRLVILGPDPSRLAFEHEYATLYQRPGRFLDVGVAPALRPDELLDQLRFIAFSHDIFG